MPRINKHKDVDKHKDEYVEIVPIDGKPVCTQHRWKKGDPSPNPLGRPRLGFSLAEHIRGALMEQMPGDDPRTKMDALLDKVLEKAMEGDVTAARELWDRGYGKAVERVLFKEAEDDVDTSLLTLTELDILSYLLWILHGRSDTDNNLVRYRLIATFLSTFVPPSSWNADVVADGVDVLDVEAVDVV